MRSHSVATKSNPPVDGGTAPVVGLAHGPLRRVATALCVLAGVAVLVQGAASAASKGNPKPAVGPSLSVIGFGVNRLFVPKGTTVKSSAMCDEMVDSDSPIGPPQQVYLTVDVRAIDIPSHAPTQIKDSLPEGEEELDSPELTPPVPFSRAFAQGTFLFGAPPGSQKDLFYTPIVSSSAEEGEYEGPSAEEFDGTYSYTAAVKVGPHTLTSTAKVTVDCPQLR